ncbi:S28 family serine protease [soil metagenome]
MPTMKARLVLGWIVLAAVANAQDLAAQIEALPGVVAVAPATGPAKGKDTYEVTFEQPVDHEHPEGAKFRQRVFLRHAGFDRPVILGTEGYSADRPSGGELAQMIENPNLITVEHRYFAKSTPNPIVWKQLTVKNAAADMHAIVSSLKRLYTGKWVSMGYSKGGQTALFFKCFYPNDVDATVAFVAPINLGQEDPRLVSFFETIGDETGRKRMRQFQIALLKREDEIIPLLKAKPEDYSMGLAKAYEYGVLEFPFAFWQYGSKGISIPAPDAPAGELVKAYNAIGALYYYSDAGRKRFEPFQYQAYTEIGYYNYDITDLKPYLGANPNPTNMDLCPPGVPIAFNPATLAFVYHTLQYESQNVAFVYGGEDAWSATQMELIGHTNAIKIVVKNANHGASVHAASPEQKELFYSTLEGWLGLKLNRV